ncbi:AAA family ATPase [Nocardia pulmonis]
MTAPHEARNGTGAPTAQPVPGPETSAPISATATPQLPPGPGPAAQPPSAETATPTTRYPAADPRLPQAPAASMQAPGDETATPTTRYPATDPGLPHAPTPGARTPGDETGTPTTRYPGTDPRLPHVPTPGAPAPGDETGTPATRYPGTDPRIPHAPGPAMPQSGPAAYHPRTAPPAPGGDDRAPGHYNGTNPAAAGYAAPYEQPGPPYAPPHGGQWQQPGGQWGTPQPQHFGQQGPPPSLDDVPVRRAKKAPGSGWRRAVHHMSGGAINPGMSAEERRLQELVARIRQPVRGDYRIAVLSLKGGVGKTTTTMGIGSIFASIRGDRVIAVDANPDFGTLSQRVSLQTRSTVRDLLLDQSIRSYSDVRRHTSQATSRLEVLASERDPAASEAFSEEEYRKVARILQRFYNIILTDCGTGLMHSAMAGVLDLAHSLVLISSSAIDGARSAAATLDWLSLHGHDHLVRNAVVVINLPRPGSPNVGIQQLREYFLSRCRAVHIIPYDPHLSEGAEIDLARLHKNTKRALVELAATVADDFATDHRRYSV